MTVNPKRAMGSLMMDGVDERRKVGRRKKLPRLQKKMLVRRATVASAKFFPRARGGGESKDADADVDADAKAKGVAEQRGRRRVTKAPTRLQAKTRTFPAHTHAHGQAPHNPQ